MTTQAKQRILEAFQIGQLAEAEQLARSQLEQQGGDEDLLFLLALSLQQQQKFQEALPVYAELARLFPENSLHVGNHATALRDAGALDEAEEAYRVSLRLDPANTEQLLNLGMLQLQQHRFIEARDTLLDAFAIEPDVPSIRIHAARACAACRDDQRVDELLKPWRSWLPLEPDEQFELAMLQLMLGDANSVQALLEDLLMRMPSHLQAQLQLASVYERVNQLDLAEARLQEIEAGQREHESDDTVRREIAHQRATLAVRRGDMAAGRALLELAGPRTPGDYTHYFILAGVCDKLGDLPGALRALESAHALQAEEMRAVVPDRYAPDAPIIPTAVGRVTAQDFRAWPTLSAPDASHSPVFIVGFPRSGTTLLEQMLDAHPKLQSMDERPFFNVLVDRLDDHEFQFPRDMYKLDQRDCDELRKAYVSMVCTKVPRRWDTQLVDKNPLNMLWLPMIHRLFPEAKIILALRHPCDVLLSNYMQNFRSTVLAMACESLPQLARAYVTAMECWLDHVEVFKPNVFISRYEELVADTVGQTRKIAEFIGLEDASAMLNFDQHARDKGYIATPSYAQVIVPVNRKGLNRWVRYREALAPALPILQPMLDHWGYSVDAPV
ncbi:sulfotransferase [Rhodanobacter ginsengisoli]|uniref:Sulfotransferase n=1 Tax=Rhodanobacter ginsengisoli TaxID=418646 RepID=A0ABW0QJE2_9GAMM